MNISEGNLTIRNATEDDAKQLCTWWNDGVVMAHAGFPKGLGITEKEVRKSLAEDDDNACRRFIVLHSGVPIGEMNYRNKGDFTAEIGIKICISQSQENGYGTKLLTMLIDNLFNDFGYKKIILDTNSNNTRAQHVYEKLGFYKLRMNTNSWRNQLGELQSSIDYELKSEDWRK